MSDDEIPDDFRVVVTDWADVDAARRLSGPEKDLVATIFRDTDFDHVAWIPDWKLDEDDNEVAAIDDDGEVDVAGSSNLVVGSVEDYSEGAVRVFQYHRKTLDDVADPGCYVPKKSVIWLERGPGMDDLDTPQRGLADFEP